MSQVNMSKKIDASISKLTKSEKITKEVLGLVSRDILEYIGQNKSTDIGTVNRLLDVLTPRNRKISVLFFDNFLHFKYDTETEHFTTMLKGEKLLDKYQVKVDTFMKDEANNVWTYAARELTDPEPKAKNFQVKLVKLVSDALKHDTESLTVEQVMQAVIQGGVSVNDIWDTIDGEMAPSATPTTEETMVAVN